MGKLPDLLPLPRTVAGMEVVETAMVGGAGTAAATGTAGAQAEAVRATETVVQAATLAAKGAKALAARRAAARAAKAARTKIRVRSRPVAKQERPKRRLVGPPRASLEL